MVNSPDDPTTSAGPANPEAVKEFWLSCAKPAQQRGTLEKLPTVKGTSKRGKEVARRQAHLLTRTVFSGANSALYQRNYDRIQWNHTGGDVA